MKLQSLYNKLIQKSFSSIHNYSVTTSLSVLFKNSSHILTHNKIDHILKELTYKNVHIPTIPRKPYALS